MEFFSEGSDHTFELLILVRISLYYQLFLFRLLHIKISFHVLRCIFNILNLV
jgi:hypothetical protein